jgi:hypothetical protein
MVEKKYWYVMYYIMYQYFTLDTKINLPPPGIEPRSPASQVGTLPKELSRQNILVLQIRDFYPESRIQIRLFSIPDPTCLHSRSQIPDPHQRI